MIKDMQSTSVANFKAAVGSAVGLGTSHLFMDAWNPEPTSVLFAGVWAGQMGIAMNEMPTGYRVRFSTRLGSTLFTYSDGGSSVL